MKYTPVSIFIGLLCTSAIKSSNILVFVPSPWKSHIASFQPLFVELAHRGHNVTVVTQFAVKKPPSNYTQVLLKSDFTFASNNCKYL
jgi:glucuronosyltransferase